MWRRENGTIRNRAFMRTVCALLMATICVNQLSATAQLTPPTSPATPVNWYTHGPHASADGRVKDWYTGSGIYWGTMRSYRWNPATGSSSPMSLVNQSVVSMPVGYVSSYMTYKRHEQVFAFDPYIDGHSGETQSNGVFGGYYWGMSNLEF